MSSYRIPFNKPCLTGNEFNYVSAAIKQGHASGDGPFTKKCQALLETILGTPKVLLTTSCTHALEIAALLLDLQPGDEVIVPSFTFVSTANAFALRGAKLVFADIRRDTLNMDERHVERLLTPRTRAIVPVHYAGVGCDMDTITALAASNSATVIEDDAHGLLGRYKGRLLGTIGQLATLSFHETKNLECGEGGAILVNDPALMERAEIIREKGTDRSRFFRGQVDKYTWVDLGSSYVLSDLLAAFLFAQLESRDHIQTQRRRVWSQYANDLASWAAEHGIGTPIIPAECEQPFHMFYLIMNSLAERQAFIAHLAARGILAVFHYQPLHLSPMGRRFGGKPQDCPVTEDIADRLVRLPLYSDLSPAETSEVVKAVTSFS